MSNLTELKEQLAQHGQKIDGAAFRNLSNKFREEAELEARGQLSNGNRWASTVIKWGQSAAVIVFAFLILVVGVVYLLVSFLVVEYHSIVEGVKLYIDTSYIASTNSITIVLGIVVTLYISFALRDNVQDEEVPQPTIKNLTARFIYFFNGVYPDGYVKPSPSYIMQLYVLSNQALTLLKVSLFVHSVMGRLSILIEDSVDDNVGTFFYNLYRNGDVLTLLSIIGTVALVWAGVEVIRLVVLFFYNMFNSVVGEKIDLGKSHQSLSEMSEMIYQKKMQTWMENRLIQLKSQQKLTENLIE